MSDVATGQGGSGFRLPSLREIGDTLRSGDIALAIGVMSILVVLILPLPPVLLDFALAISIITSVLILMTALFIHKPLEFSVFPTVLLMSTMLRLSLNLASTRLILSHGHEGPSAAGHVIEAFGNFVMGGNFVIGIIVFTILVIVNFVVITKGSGRIAEVAARFNLDAMPGKQMAIDADLSAGLIDEKEARARRKGLEDESSFFGAMDGASKFVRGDAIAGLLVVFINIIGGIIIGIAQQGISFAEAGRTYTLLTVGDGLVTQIPALIVSTAAGLLVSKAGLSEAADKVLLRQLSGYPKALGMSSAVMVAIGLLPGIPMLPFLLLGGGAGALAWIVDKRAKDEVQVAAATTAAAAAAPAEEPISAALKIDDLKIELGYALLPLVNSPDGSDRLTEQIKALRRSLAMDMGFVMPAVRILDNVQLDANTYVIKIKEVEGGSGRVWPGQYMAMDPMGGQVNLPGMHTTEPTFGLPATWIDAGLKEEAAVKGYTVVDAATVLATHLTEQLKANISELLSYAEVQKLLRELPKEQAELVKEIVPGQITVTGIQRVLQLLLTERISIRDLGTILEGIADALSFTRSPNVLVEHVRTRLARQICAQYTTAAGHLPLIALSARWEQAFAESIVGQGDDRQLAMQPSRLSEFITLVRERFEEAARMGEAPVLVTSPGIRPFVRSIVERFRSQTPVLSQSEIHPRARLRTVGSI
ncbi:flagellar biosynthesis protein FlhA [Rhodoplanes sp. TEM]|uniref:Flagellar biosynthesis protein FlhA n=1 Tax=Rhodoplanes tepidamans TaxID=200616 RepID=A0ABT5J658_RHOTP|nr:MULTISPECIES: flagellar biosynthesis protein FlhA [Rhodoplanes]MDC7785110.1 flagellar biosynthesis protein FlhA [Rhodoplanes tepidamans]MDC7982584.1 flagellar biosynthesis protein FlhA [Rhodoplanes sp. TEM]MDQ0356600.1 flagellar biosynthesis protein FlhA [Rhodoplanes tepidamans]